MLYNSANILIYFFFMIHSFFLLFLFLSLFNFNSVLNVYFHICPLRKHAYSNILIFFPPKNEFFSYKNSDIFNISAQNIDCGRSLEPPRRGGSNEYPQSMFLSRNKKNNVYPYQPQFYYIKAGFKGVKLYWYVLVMV